MNVTGKRIVKPNAFGLPAKTPSLMNANTYEKA